MKYRLGLSITLLYMTHLLLHDSSLFWITKKYYPHSYTQQQTSFQSSRLSFPIFDTVHIAHYSKQCASCSILPFQKFVATMTRIQHILYVGGQDHTQHADYFVQTIDFVTSLETSWYYPYVFAQLLWPQQKTNAHNKPTLTSDQNKIIALWEKWVTRHCDRNKIQAITQLSDEKFYNLIQQKFYTKEKEKMDAFTSLLNPCPDYQLPYYLAFNYFTYFRDEANAQKYFRVAALQQDAPRSASFMPAILAWQAGNYKKSSLLRFIQYQISIENQAKQQEQQQFLYKSIMNYSLDLLQQASQQITKKGKWESCAQDLLCIKPEISWLIALQIKECKQHKTAIDCILLQEWIKNNFIQKDGTLQYPFDVNNYHYARDETLSNRRITSKTSS